MRRSLLLVFALTLLLPGKAETAAEPFSIKLEREGCLGPCPGYTITIHEDGRVEYEGLYYVKVVGARKTAVSPVALQKLIRKLQKEHVLEWEEKDYVCLDYSQVKISLTLNGKSKHLIEGCEKPGKVLELAKEIDRFTGSKRWVGHVR
jgi:hypothetical protein